MLRTLFGKGWKVFKVAEHAHFGEILLSAVFDWRPWVVPILGAMMTLLWAAIDGRSPLDVWLAAVGVAAGLAIIGAVAIALWDRRLQRLAVPTLEADKVSQPALGPPGIEPLYTTAEEGKISAPGRINGAGIHRDLRDQRPDSMLSAQSSHTSIGIPSSPSTQVTSRPYTGVQANPFDDQSIAIFNALLDARSRERGLLAPASLRCLEFQMPRHIESIETKNHKFSLYGGFQPNRRNFSPLDYVVLGFPFQRNAADALSSHIVNSSDFFSSHTIVAHPGQGSSIALAQTLLSLSKHSGFLALWNFDHSVSFGEHSTVSSIDDYFRTFDHVSLVPTRLIFAFDDLSKRTQADQQAIYIFQNLCHNYAEQRKRPISFLFSSNEISFSPTDKTITLKLEDDEEHRLWLALTELEPLIVRTAFPTLEELLFKHAASTTRRNIKADVQSFIDFIIVHSTPIREFRLSWFGNVPESQCARRILSVLAVSQLFDLRLPQRIASAIASASGCSLAEINDAYALLAAWMSQTHEPIGDEWAGLALSSPYRARSLLRLLGVLDKPFVASTLSDIVRTSLEFGDKDIDLWHEYDSEFVRHIFQRLAKPQLYLVPEIGNKSLIANELFAGYGQHVYELLRRVSDRTTYAKWAGTLSPFLMDSDFREDENCIERLIYKLCSASVNLHNGDAMEESRIFVSLLRAIKRLHAHFPYHADVRTLAAAVQRIADLDQVLHRLMIKDDPQWERRANETLLVYMEFLFEVYEGKPKWRDQKIVGLYERIRRDFATFGFKFDAGNNSMCAARIAIDGPHDVPNIKLRASYLLEASRVVRVQIREQGTWKRRIDKQVEWFNKAPYGPLEKYAMLDVQQGS